MTNRMFNSIFKINLGVVLNLHPIHMDNYFTLNIFFSFTFISLLDLK